MRIILHLGHPTETITTVYPLDSNNVVVSNKKQTDCDIQVLLNYTYMKQEARKCSDKNDGQCRLGSPSYRYSLCL